jgi:filamentous hemagglutinin family protein
LSSGEGTESPRSRKACLQDNENKKMARKIFLTAVFALIVTGTAIGHAGVVLDGTLGRSGPLTGPNYMINADLGKQVGGNLFHSFSSFNITRTESAVFRGPGAVENIISRVTGGSSSTIDGLLKSEIQGANLYFLNPAGIMFGPNAKLDVSGSFHATTADYLKLGGSGIVYADTINTSVLTSAPPSAYGFLDRTSYGKISNYGFLEVPEGKAVSFVGGDITIENGNILAPRGTVNVISTASAGEAVSGAAGYSVDSFAKMGTVNVVETRPSEERPVRLDRPIGNIDVSGASGGNIFIRAGGFVLDGGYLYADTLADGNGMGIDMRLTDRISLVNGSVITSRSYGVGAAGGISITTPLFTMEGGSGVVSRAISSGKAGDIILATDTLDIKDSRIDASTLGAGQGGQITVPAAEKVNIAGYFTDAAGNYTFSAGLSSGTGGAGDAGAISVTTPLMTMDNFGLISAAAYEGSSGKGGDIALNVGTLSLKNGAFINLQAEGSGNGGSLIINAAESINLAGYVETAGNLYRSGFFANTLGAGNGSSLSVKTPVLVMDDYATIASYAESSGNAGNMDIKVDTLDLNRGALITTATYGEGRGGNIAIDAAKSVLLSGDWTTLSSDVYSSGQGGSIRVNTPAMTLESSAKIEAYTNDTGNGGNILLNVDTFEAKNGAQIKATSGSSGNGGNLILKASESVLITGPGTRLNYDSSGSGSTGSISITSPSVLINDGAVISNDKGNGSSGKAGDIAITAERLVLDTNAGISNSAQGETGDGGNIIINVGRLFLTNGGYISSSGFWGGRSGVIMANASESIFSSGFSSGLKCYNGGSDPGGEIVIKTLSLTLEDGASIAASTDSSGAGGMIILDVGSLILTGGAGISSGNLFDAAGNGGDITVKASDSVRISSLFSGISANTSSEGSGGNIHVSTPSLILDEGNITASTSGPGHGGDIVLDIGSLIVKNNASIRSDTWKSTSSDGSMKGGHGGTVTVNASGSILLSGSLWAAALSTETATSGNGGSINVTTPSLIMEDRAGIAAGSSESGNAGDVSLNIGALTMNSGAQITSLSLKEGRSGTVNIHASESIDISGDISESAYWTGISCETSGNGAGGSMMIQTPLLRMTDHAQLSVSSFGLGNAGDVLLTTDRLTLLNGSQIHSAGLDAGNSGSLNITVRDTALMSGMYTNDKGESYSSGLLVGSYGTGKGGRIELSAGTLLLEKNALISSVSTGIGNAGNIFVTADMLRSDNAFITTEALKAAGGNIQLNARDLILTDRSAITASVAAGEGGGGNVSIGANVLVALDDSDITAKADQGYGGNITIDALSVFTTKDVDFDASSNVTGREGKVEVRSPVTDISSGIVDLPAAFLNIDAFLPKQCAEREEEASSFVVRGRDGIPPQPESLFTGQ